MVRAMAEPGSSLAAPSERADRRPGAPIRPAIVLAGTVLLLWPSLLNWHPYLFWDSYGYFLQGKAYAQLLLGWLGLAPAPVETEPGWIGAAARMLARDPAIRSPSWSLLSYVLAVSGSFWLLALLNAAVAAATLELVLVRLFNVLPARRLAIVAGMASLTSLPWFACFLMPDLYAGLLILAAGIVAFAWPTLRPAERYAGSMLLLLAITFHGSHLLLAVTLMPIAMLLPLAHDTRRARAMRLTLPILAAVAFQLGVSWLGFSQLTLTPQAPPFLLARSWEDGPARAYLTAACPDAGWTICAHLDRLAASAQEFLWRAQDSYWSLDLDQRAALRAEEGAILRQAIGAAPLAQLRASTGNALDQLVRFGLDDFVLGRGAAVTPDDYTFVYLPLAPAAVWGLGLFSATIYLTVLAASAVVAAKLWRHRSPATDPAIACCLLVLAALVLNAAICGVLSGPNDRYQARVAWLLPLMAAGLMARSRQPRAAAP